MADRAPHIADTAPGDWKYVAEGGSTIVFSYSGAPHPHFDGTALRLRKAHVGVHGGPGGRGGRPPLEAGEQDGGDDGTEGAAVDGVAEEAEAAEVTVDGGAEEEDDPTIVFQRSVVERLVPAAFLPRLDAVRVERAWLEKLAAAAEGQRPAARRAKDAIDTGRRKAVLATDLVGGEGWAVEIKPKWGFLPAAEHLSPATRALKTRTCRFCMHARLKAARGEPAAAPGYCPLDLFAGGRDADRVVRALGALWDAWVESGGAVNNLRVFVGGRRVVPSAEPSSLAPLAAQLLPPSTEAAAAPDSKAEAQADPDPDADALRAALADALLPVLLGTPVLPTLAGLQRTLDALDVEGLAALWARLRPRPVDGEQDGEEREYGYADVGLGEGEREPDIAEWTRFVDAYAARYAARYATGNGSGEGEGSDGGKGEGAEDDEAELRFRLLAYLLSASFKDCSLIVRMRPAPPGTPGRFVQTVTVIDLDVKGVDRLAKWARLDKEIVEAYRGAEPKECVDSWA